MQLADKDTIFRTDSYWSHRELVLARPFTYLTLSLHGRDPFMFHQKPNQQDYRPCYMYLFPLGSPEHGVFVKNKYKHSYCKTEAVPDTTLPPYLSELDLDKGRVWRS
jgi:hypothetical protein